MIHLSQAWRRARRSRRRGRLAVAGLALAGIAATLVAGGPVANAHPGQPSAMFDPNEVGWHELRERTEAKFRGDMDHWKEIGSIPVDIEADGFNGTPWFASTVQRNIDDRDWRVEPRMTKAEYTAAAAEALADGMRLFDREIYVAGGTEYFAAGWVANSENYGWTTWYGLTLAQLNAHALEQRRLGRLPIDYDMRRTPGGIRYDVVFLQNAEGWEWELDAGLTEAQYVAAFGGYSADGLRMLSFDSAYDGVQQLFGAIAVENVSGRGWRWWRSMDAHQYGNNWHMNADEGYRQIFVGRYQTSTGTKYASGWRQNTPRPNWPYRLDVDGYIQTELGEDDAPGIAVAVMVDGVFRYTRGFGKADIAADEWMDSGHVMRLASVSKAVGGAVTMRLHEQGVVDRDQTAGHYYPALDDQHVATLEQLASNRGCVRHYAGDKESSLKVLDPEQYAVEVATDAHLAETDYPDARTAVAEFDSDPLRSYTGGGGVSTSCTPGASSLYSTHGGTVLAAAAEEASGVTAKDLVLQQISDPLELETLRLEDMTDTDVRRAKLYSGPTNTLATPDKISWKPFSGGLESNVRDICRFGYAMIAGHVVSDTDYIWDGTDNGWDYAYGWDVGSTGGHRYASKSGGQLGSDAYLLVFPDDNISIAVQGNRKKLSDAGAHAPDIAWYIGDLLV